MTLTHRLALAAMFAGAAAFAQTVSGSTGSQGTAADPTPGSQSNRPSTSTAKTPSATESGKTAAHLTASGVLSMIHQVNQDEIRLAKTAQAKAQNDKVKDYAKDMIDDHTALDKKLTDFVQKEGKGKVTLSSNQIPADKRKELKSMVGEAEQELKSAGAGATFDQSYMSAMVRSHEAVLSDLEAALPSLKGNDKVYDLVSSARDKIKDHRDHATDIVKDLNRGAAVGGSGMGTPESDTRSVGGGAPGATTGTRDTSSGGTTKPSNSTPTTPSPSTSGSTGR